MTSSEPGFIPEADPLEPSWCCQDSEDGGWGDDDQEMLVELDLLAFGEEPAK